MSKFKEIVVDVPKHDCDVLIRLPGGKQITVQLRPSNADVNYNGSLDIILPENNLVTCWRGDDMDASVAPDSKQPHERFCKQLVAELPGDYS